MKNPLYFKYTIPLFVYNKYAKFYRKQTKVRCVPLKPQDIIQHDII